MSSDATACVAWYFSHTYPLKYFAQPVRDIHKSDFLLTAISFIGKSFNKISDLKQIIELINDLTPHYHRRHSQQIVHTLKLCEQPNNHGHQ